MLLVFILAFASCLQHRGADARILQHRDPKIDAKLVESVLADVVTHSMSDLRERLRVALSRVLFPSSQNPDKWKISVRSRVMPVTTYAQDEEEQLVASFINQLMEQRATQLPGFNNDHRFGRLSTQLLSEPIKIAARPLSDDPIDTRIARDQPKANFISPSESDDPMAQKMTVALETVTTRVPTRVVTIDELQMSDDDRQHAAGPSLISAASSLPPWLIVFFGGSIVFAVASCSVALVKLLRARPPRKAAAAARFPDPLTISGFTCGPSCDGGPGSFLERMQAMKRGPRIQLPAMAFESSEREEPAIWRSASSMRTHMI